MTGLELVVAWLAAYLWAKARRAAGKADAEATRLVDAVMTRLHDLVAAKLGDDPALVRLATEAAVGDHAPIISDRTRQPVQLALEEATDSDPSFAAEGSSAHWPPSISSG